MELSERLLKIEEFIPKCCCLADVGTDHAYIPILSVNNGKCQKAIATDINKGPVIKADKNIREHLLTDKIQTRLGPGLSVVSLGEAEVIVIAGMGGNLISDILTQDLEKAKKARILILQPMTHQDVLRDTLSRTGFSIIDEELVKEDRHYYQIIKASAGEGDKYNKKSEYLLGLKLMAKRHPLLKGYISYYKEQLHKVLGRIDSKEQKDRYTEVTSLLYELEEVEGCL